MPLAAVGASQVLQIVTAVFGTVGNLAYGDRLSRRRLDHRVRARGRRRGGVRLAHAASVDTLRRLAALLCIAVGVLMLWRTCSRLHRRRRGALRNPALVRALRLLVHGALRDRGRGRARVRGSAPDAEPGASWRWAGSRTRCCCARTAPSSSTRRCGALRAGSVLAVHRTAIGLRVRRGRGPRVGRRRPRPLGFDHRTRCPGARVGARPGAASGRGAGRRVLRLPGSDARARAGDRRSPRLLGRTRRRADRAWRSCARAMAGAAGDVRECGFDAANSLRVESGYILFTNELADSVNPFELGLGGSCRSRRGRSRAVKRCARCAGANRRGASSDSTIPCVAIGRQPRDSGAPR